MGYDVSGARAVELARLAYEAWRESMPDNYTPTAREVCINPEERDREKRQFKLVLQKYDLMTAVERNAWVDAVHTVLRSSEDANAKGAA